MATLESAVDTLFDGTDALSATSGEKLLEIVRGNLGDSEKHFFRYFFGIPILWLIQITASAGMVKNASFVGVEFDDISFLLLIVPIVVGVFVYGLFAALCAYVINLVALRRIVRHHLPVVSRAELDELLSPPSFLAMEMVVGKHLTGKWSSIDMTWKFVLSATFIILPIMSLVHCTAITLKGNDFPLWLELSSLSLAFLLAGRGGLLFYNSLGFSNG
jgi:hypothetical protein